MLKSMWELSVQYVLTTSTSSILYYGSYMVMIKLITFQISAQAGYDFLKALVLLEIMLKSLVVSINGYSSQILEKFVFNR